MKAKKKSREAAEEVDKLIECLLNKDPLTAIRHAENAIVILNQSDPVDPDQSG